MSKAYVIQIAGQTAGIVARDAKDELFQFFASSPAFYDLDGRAFTQPLQAERAARRLHKAARRPARHKAH